MQRRISRYINSELLKARLKLTGINSSPKNQEQSRFALYRFEIFPIVHFFRIARDTRVYARFAHAVSVVASPPESRCRPYRETVFRESRIPEITGDAKGASSDAAHAGSTLRRVGKRDIAVLRTASARPPKRKRFRRGSGHRRYISLAETLAYIFYKIEKKKKKN